MDVTDSSDNVILPDISEAEHLVASEHDSARNNGGVVLVGASGTIDNISGALTTRSGRLTADSNDIVTVPVSLPVGSLVSGSTFNVITSDQLPHLCVDNGFISRAQVITDSDIKATHIVIQQGPAEPNSPPQSSWAETANMSVLPVRCKNTSAELHKSRFGSGGRGRCIKLGQSWYTPSEFENYCGRGSSKDWKRSIRFGGRSIQTLVDEGFLTPHATSCTCGACCDDEIATGPVRLFTPYKRRRRQAMEGQCEEHKRRKSNRNNSADESDNDPLNMNLSAHTTKEEAWQSLADGIDAPAEYQLLDNPVPSPGLMDNNISPVLKRLSELSQQLIRFSTELKRCVTEVKTMAGRQNERMQQDRNSVLIDTEAEQTQQLQGVEASSKKCANCDREASAECSLCRRTPYCSTYCQRKDWGAHQIECVRGVTVAEHSNSQSIMLIVDNQHQ